MGSIRHQIATFFRRWARPTGVSVRQNRARLNLTALEARDVPATLTVNTPADNTTADGFLSLREAIALVNNAGNANAALGRALTGGEQNQINATTPFGTSDTIIFAPSVFTTGVTITVGTVLPALNQNVSIQGLGLSRVTINGNQLGSVLTVGPAATVSISGVTLTNGNATLGGGINNQGILTLDSSLITGNTATQSGGGILNDSSGVGILTITNSTISGNTVVFGGGGNGGGIFTFGGTVTITNSTISGNTADSDAGISNSGTVTITNSTISGNTSATTGGGIGNAGILTSTNSTIAGNTAGAVIITTASWAANLATITTQTAHNLVVGQFVTIAGINPNGYNGTFMVTAAPTGTTFRFALNSDPGAYVIGGSLPGGGGIYDASGSQATLRNTIVAGNTNGDISAAGVVTANSFNNLIGTGGSGLTNGITGNLVGVSPGLGTVADNGGPTKTIALLAGSPAINAGKNTVAPATDQRGITRNGVADIGPYEFIPVVVTPPLVMTPSSLPAGQVGQAYSQTISATGSGSVSLLVVGSSLPPGLTISQSGLGGPITISGTPTGPGAVSGTVTVAAADQQGSTTTTYTVTVRQAPTVSVAYGPTGFVVLTVDSNGILSSGGATLATGVRDASVAFGPTGIVVVVTYQTGALVQYSSSGAQILTTSGIQGTSVAFGKTGEILLITTEAGAVYRFDSTGLHLLVDQGFLGASLAIEPSGEVLLATTTTGTLYRLDSTGLSTLMTNVYSAGIAYGPFGETTLIVLFDGSLVLLDATGLHTVGTVA